MPESVLLSDQGQSFQLGGTGVIFKLLANQTNGAVALVEHIVAPGTLAEPPHTHQNEDEISYILEGELTIQVGESIIHALVNTLIMKPRRIQHAFWNAGETPVRLLEIITPAGFEQYFQEMASIVSSGGLADSARRTSLYEKYHLTVDRTAAEALLQEYNLKW